MKDDERVERAIQLLMDDPSLQSISVARPGAIMMPFAKDKQKRYIMIGLFVAEQALKRTTLVLACKRAVSVLKQNHVLDGIDGVEIMPSFVREGRSNRILRLTILAHALQRSEQLTAADLNNAELAEGITCFLYLSDIPD